MSRRHLTMVLGVAVLAACAAPAQPAVVPDPVSSMAPAVTDVAPASVGGGPERVHAAPRARPAQPVLEPRFGAALVEDHCVDRDLAASAASDAIFTVLDRSYALPAAYAPPDLVSISAAGVAGGVSGTPLVRSVIIDDLDGMRSAWEDDGLSLIIESAYRSHASQAATFDAWMLRLGRAGALLRTARPGHSEHQLGTALDVSSPGWTGRVGDWAAESAEGAWMAAHAWEYGFVMSYPADSTAKTCFAYEPWHYRWIGREAAAAHRASGLTLREFLERYLDS